MLVDEAGFCTVHARTEKEQGRLRTLNGQKLASSDCRFLRCLHWSLPGGGRVAAGCTVLGIPEVLYLALPQLSSTHEDLLRAIGALAPHPVIDRPTTCNVLVWSHVKEKITTSILSSPKGSYPTSTAVAALQVLIHARTCKWAHDTIAQHYDNPIAVPKTEVAAAT